MKLSYIKGASDPLGDAGDPYTGYDRFNRSLDLRWSMSSGGALREEKYQVAKQNGLWRLVEFRENCP